MSALTIPRFATIWIIIGSILCIWDAGFVLNRPRTFVGGDLFWLYQPYTNYIALDMQYGDVKSSFVVAQTFVNIMEIIGGLLSIMLYHGTKNAKVRNFASLLLLITSTATFCKTVLYFLNDIVDTGIHPQNHPGEFFSLRYWFFFLIPNTFWVVLPFTIMKNVTKQVLSVCEQVQLKAKKN